MFHSGPLVINDGISPFIQKLNESVISKFRRTFNMIVNFPFVSFGIYQKPIIFA